MANVPWIGTGGLPLLGSGGAPLICDDAEDCACDTGEVTIDTCEELETCLGVVGDVADPISVTISGVTDNGCEDCEFINNTYLIEDTEYASCSVVWGELDVGSGACCSNVGVRVDLVFDEVTPPTGTFILVQFRCIGDTEQADYFVEGADAVTAINELCSTGSTTIPYYPDSSTWSDCDWPATVLLEI